jgi:hypothetical protein
VSKRFKKHPPRRAGCSTLRLTLGRALAGLCPRCRDEPSILSLAGHVGKSGSGVGGGRREDRLGAGKSSGKADSRGWRPPAAGPRTPPATLATPGRRRRRDRMPGGAAQRKDSSLSTTRGSDSQRERHCEKTGERNWRPLLTCCSLPSLD